MATAVYRLEMHDDSDGHGTAEIYADSHEEALALVEGEIESWVEGGEWGDEGAMVSVPWVLTAIPDPDDGGDEEEIGCGAHDVEIPPDEDALIRAAGGDPDCRHEWTSEGDGGCDDNPGVWSLGGTTFSHAEHCRKCGLRRVIVTHGSQRNPGQADEVEYTQPSSWCAEHQSDDDECPECSREEV